MRNLFSRFLFVSILYLGSCSQGPDSRTLEGKKEILQSKEKDLKTLEAEINILKKEIAKEDPNFAEQMQKPVLVTTMGIAPQSFTRYVEVQGVVESDQNVILSAETNGVVGYIPVKEGQYVGSGQLLISQKSHIIQKSIDEVKTGLELADIVFKRQANLWEQEIGTELQYLEAKNNKERFEKQLNTLRAQMNQAQTYAPFAGVVDEIFIRKGQNAGPGSPLLRLVSSRNVQVVAYVSESYLSRINRGDQVSVHFPSLGLEKDAPVSLVGQTIDPDSRTFRIEVAMNNPENQLKPELIAKVKFKESQADSVLAVPTNLIQQDKVGDFVFVVEKKDKKLLAKKVRIKRGDSNEKHTLVQQGLQSGSVLIVEGFQEVVDGTPIKDVSTKGESIVQAH